MEVCGYESLLGVLHMLLGCWSFGTGVEECVFIGGCSPKVVLTGTSAVDRCIDVIPF